MSSQLSICIPERYWMPIECAPLDGTMVFLRDADGWVDVAVWDHGEWNCELGMAHEPTQYARLSISPPADRCASGCRLKAAVKEFSESTTPNY